MSDKPILFSGPMVRAILEGRKSQTRRIFKGTSEHRGEYNPAYLEQYRGSDGWGAIAPHPVGSTMWVRETWGYRGGVWHCGEEADRFAEVWIDYKAGGKETFRRPFDDKSGLPEQVCRCKGGGPDEHGEEMRRYWASWRPSIFMPRWASRITLKVTEVRVQRLQEISEEDAKAEGALWHPEETEKAIWWQGYRTWDMNNGVELMHQTVMGGEEPPDWMIEPHRMLPHVKPAFAAKAGYRNLWESINGPGSWDANPWVWVYTFEREMPKESAGR